MGIKLSFSVCKKGIEGIESPTTESGNKNGFRILQH